MEKTAFVLVTDKNYFFKASVTINDLRTVGRWEGDVVLITIDFDLPDDEYKKKNNIQEVKFPLIDKTLLLKQIGEIGFENSDKRELNKLNQWEKFHVFDDYFLQWQRVVYLDSGLRVLDDVKYILELDYKNKILAPVAGLRPTDIFQYQLDHKNKEKIEEIKNEFGEEIFQSHFMLNCMWIYDTQILNICNKTQFLQAMNTYPVCRSNEMDIMNLLLHFKYKLWARFPFIASNGKYLFEWSDLNKPNTIWRNYCFLKYPVSIHLHQTVNSCC